MVKEAGKKVTRVKPGDRVGHEIVTFYCGHCPACLEGRFNICNTIPPMQGRAHYVTGGGIRGGITAEVDTYKIIVKELNVIGEISQIPYDWKTAIHLRKSGKIELDSLVTHVFPLEEWKKGFDLAAKSPECLRVALKP